MNEASEPSESAEGLSDTTPKTFSFYVCECPGCGTLVVLPHDWATAVALDSNLLGQLAQAACGCWILRLRADSLAHSFGCGTPSVGA
jgi:hypothetical protein